MPTYIYDTVLSYAAQITKAVGEEKLYTETNEKHPNAPYNIFVKDSRLVIPVVKQQLENAKTPKRIHLLPVKHVDAVHGLYENMAENIYICYAMKISDCWQRFTIMKELCSAYTGHYQDDKIRNTIYESDVDYVHSIEEAFWNKVNYVNKDGLYDGDIDSETFAILLATEIMVPKSSRHITTELLKLADDKNSVISLNDVAKSLMIPEAVLKYHKMKGYI